MYPTSNSSSSSRDTNAAIINGNNNPHSGAATTGGSIGLARYRSAPVAFLNTTVDSVINEENNAQQHTVRNHHIVNNGGSGAGNGTSTPTRFFSPPNTELSERSQTTSFRLNEFASAFKGANQSQSPLFRHGSSPAGFLNTLASSTPTGTYYTSSFPHNIYYSMSSFFRIN
ncbi:hypothetical protein QVD17_01833 [Tagetes erecta]|uniref:Uncharacterized protein n=1 Tax=Tagetes erecta TaxID=13708 RepID=A0AAD8LAH6_TARER|nr:hypothetical protein QVD17_01833 [Tagetes erecta]